MALPGHPLQRDAFLASLSHEDRCVSEVGEKGWESDLGKSVRNDPARRHIFSIYDQEAKFRDARAAFYKKTMDNILTFNEGDAEELMEQWDQEHAYERDCGYFSPFRQQAMRQAELRAERAKIAEAKMGKGKGIAVTVEEFADDEHEEGVAETEVPEVEDAETAVAETKVADTEVKKVEAEKVKPEVKQ